MKRRGFLGALLGLPAAPLLAKAINAPKPVPVAPVVESEPLPEHVEEVMARADGWANDCSIGNCMTCVAAPVSMNGIVWKR